MNILAYGHKMSRASRRFISTDYLAKILSHFPDILKMAGTPYFNEFVCHYSLNVRDCVNLLRRVKKSSFLCQHYSYGEIRALINQFEGLQEYSYLVENGCLSIYDQVLQFQARWLIHHWVMANEDFIIWAYHRLEYLPKLLMKYTDKNVLLPGDIIEQNLPAVDFVWFVELVGSDIAYSNGNVFNIISTKISCPEHSSAMLRLSAQLDQLDEIKDIISPVGRETIESVVRYFLKRKSIFSSLLEDGSNEIINEYMNSNTYSIPIFKAIIRCKELLCHFCQFSDFNTILKDQAIQAYLRPLLKELRSLMSFIVPLDTMKTLEAFQYFKNKKNFFTVLIFNYDRFDPIFKSYVDTIPDAKDLVRNLQTHCETLRKLLQVEDILSDLSESRMKENFRPFVNDIMAGFVTGRLQFLAEIACINNKWPPEDKNKIWLLTLLEKYCDEISQFVSEKKQWLSWIKNHSEFLRSSREFRSGLLRCIESSKRHSDSSVPISFMSYETHNSADSLSSNVGSDIPIRLNLLTVLSDLCETDTINATMKDVLLFKLIANLYDQELYLYLSHNLQKILPTLEAYSQYLNILTEIAVPKFNPRVLRKISKDAKLVDLQIKLQ